MASNPAGAVADALSKGIFDELVHDIIYSLSCEEFRLALERNLPCPHCGRRCRDLYHGQYVTPCSREASQQTMPLSTDSTVQIDCLVCQRSIASTRYAQHLSECMGLTGRKRRAPMSRTATSSSNHNNISPYLTGDSSDDENEPSSSAKKRKKAKSSNLKKEHSAYSPSPLAQSPATSQPMEPGYSANGTSTSASSSQLMPPSERKIRPAIVISDSSSDGG